YTENEDKIVPEYIERVLPPVTYINALPKPACQLAGKQATQVSAINVQKDLIPTITEHTTTPTETLSRAEGKGLETGNDNIECREGGSFIATNPGVENAEGAESGSPQGIEGGIHKTFEVDMAPEFPGGLDSFYKSVSKNFKIPEINKQTTLIVYVSFVVETDGSLSDIQVMRDPGDGLGQGAVRVVKNIRTKWRAGVKNGIPVRTSYNLPIKVKVR